MAMKQRNQFLDSISDVYLSLKNSVKDGLGSINEMRESTQRIEVSVPVYLDGGGNCYCNR